MSEAAIRLQEFDREDPVNYGRPAYVDMDKYLDVVEQLITADEVALAFDMLSPDRLPSWYRTHIPSRATAIRERLFQRFFTTLDYAKNGETVATDKEAEEYLSQPHGQILLERCKQLNDRGIVPHIEELGPGNYWVPLGLRLKGIKFTYFGPSLNSNMQAQAKFEIASNWCDIPRAGAFKIFVCFEMLEHLTDTGDIYHHYCKRGGDMDMVFISTPLYTFNGGMPDWYNKDLGHIRTYTPQEFAEYGLKTWPGYKMSRFDSPVMVLVGEK